jgi:hypothetical protein
MDRRRDGTRLALGAAGLKTRRNKMIRRTILAGLAVTGVLWGCGGNGDPGQLSGRESVGTASSALWACSTKDTRVACTAPTADTPKMAAYVCQPGEQSAKCPDQASLNHVAGLDELLQRTRTTATFGQMPWACLVTGGNQSQCMRELGPGTGGGDNGGTYTTGGSTGTGGGANVGKPPAPSSCEPKAWEPYFAQLATFEYNLNGIKITFPVDIFDTSANVVNVAVSGVERYLTVGAPSCYLGELEMRAQSWIDAVAKGCFLLAEPILVLCQQGADYAPTTKACNATGTW